MENGEGDESVPSCDVLLGEVLDLSAHRCESEVPNKTSLEGTHEPIIREEVEGMNLQ